MARPLPSAVLALVALAVILLFPSCELLSLVQAKPQDGSTNPPTTTTSDTTKPAAVKDLAALDGGPLAVKLAWSAPPSSVSFLLAVCLPEGSTWTPADGASYATGDILGDAVVVWKGIAQYCTTYGYDIGQGVHLHLYAGSKNLLYSPAAEVSFVVPDPPPRFAGFDFTLQQGDFWEYNYYYHKYADWGNTDFTWTKNFVVMLGAPSTIGGKTAYPVTLQSIGCGFEPRWKWLALENSVLYGALSESSPWTTILDAKTGYWRGGGFFVNRADTDYSKAKQSVQVIDGAVMDIVTIGSGSSTSATYTNVPGYGYIVSGEDSNYSTAEYFIANIGPGGYNEAFSLSSSSYQSSETKRVTLVSSSRTDDTPPDFQAKYSYSYPSVGSSWYIKIGPGLTGLKHDDFRGTITDTTFTVSGTQHKDLYTLAKSWQAEWVVPSSSTLGGGTPLSDLGLIKTGGTSFESVSITVSGATYSLSSGSASYTAMKTAIFALVPP
jgi:hypothetical protein